MKNLGDHGYIYNGYREFCWNRVRLAVRGRQLGKDEAQHWAQHRAQTGGIEQGYLREHIACCWSIIYAQYLGRLRCLDNDSILASRLEAPGEM